MSPPRSIEIDSNAKLRLKKARALLRGALAHALAKTAESHASAARWLGVSEHTIARWLAERSPINVEKVLASPRLATAFREHLCTHSHEQRPVAYQARRRAR
jgi:hypothetical protein